MTSTTEIRSTEAQASISAALRDAGFPTPSRTHDGLWVTELPGWRTPWQRTGRIEVCFAERRVWVIHHGAGGSVELLYGGAALGRGGFHALLTAADA